MYHVFILSLELRVIVSDLEDVLLVEFTYLPFTHMPSGRSRREATQVLVVVFV